MRSFVAVLALVASSWTEAATVPSLAPITVHPTSATRASKAQQVRVTFHNMFPDPCALTIGSDHFQVPGFGRRTILVTPGSDVQVSSQWNTHLHGQTLLTVTADDAEKTLTVQ